jgi:hypothetical protein
MRVRLAVAAAVLVGGGAAGVAVISSGGTTNVASAGFYTHTGQYLSETQAISETMNGWNHSPSTSMQTLSHMTKVSNTSTVSWHKKTLAFQRGTVSAISTKQKELVVQSANGKVEVWHWNGGTKAVNVGAPMPGVSSATSMTDLTGNTMKLPSWWGGRMNPKPTAATKGDVVFVFGEKVDGKLWAQLVLFAAPATTTVTPTVTPTATATSTATATPTATATSTAKATPTSTATTTAPTGTTGGTTPDFGTKS